MVRILLYAVAKHGHRLLQELLARLLYGNETLRYLGRFSLYWGLVYSARVHNPPPPSPQRARRGGGGYVLLIMFSEFFIHKNVIIIWW